MPRFQKIKEIVAKELSCSAHDMEHVLRVYNLALRLAEGDNVDKDVLRAATLLHDIARVKEDRDSSGKTDHAVLGAKMAGPILRKLDFSKKQIRHIQECIISHRYRTGHKAKSREAQILFDADKLDALGAIGVARTFVWVGKNKAKIYNNVDIEKYIKENLGRSPEGRIKDKTKHSPQIEFETKLKFVVDRLYTEKAREIGRKRLAFLKKFLERLEKELVGEE